MPIPSGLTTITVTSSYPAIDGSPLNGSVTFATLQPIMDAAGKIKFSGSATRPINYGTMQPIVLPCTDNSALSPSGFSYQVTETINGVTQTPYWISLPSTLGSTVDLSSLTPVAAPPSVSAFASANTWTGTNTFAGETIVSAPVNASDAATKAYVDAHAGSGAVASVFGRTGAVVAASGDYTAAQVGADPSGAATGALTAAESYADTYKLAKSANLSDLVNVATARANLGLGTAATQAATQLAVQPSGDTTGATDTAAIQAAITSQATAGGGVVTLAAGTFWITSIYLRSNVVVQGVSLQGTVLQAIASHSTSPMISLYTGSDYSWILRNLTVCGGNGPQDATYGLQPNAFACVNINAAANTGQFFGPQTTDMFGLIENVVLSQASSNNFICSGRCSEIRLSNVYAIDSGAVCYEIDGQDVFLENCTAGNSAQQGFRINTKSCQLVNCKSWWSGYTNHANGDGFIIAPGAGPGTLLTGCFAQDNFHDGFSIYGGQGVVMSGCSAAGNVNAHLGVYSTTTNCTAEVTLNTSSNNAAHASYALDWSGTPTGNTITINGDATQSANYPAGTSFAGNNVEFSNGSGNVRPYQGDSSLYLAPTGVTGEAFPRTFASGYTSALTSGTVYCTAIPLPTGLTISNLATFIGSTAFATVTHGWFALADNTDTIRAVTADQTTSLQTSYAFVKLATTASFTLTYSGLYYFVFCATAGTMGTVVNSGNNLSTPNSTSPLLAATAGTASTPPAVGSTLTLAYTSPSVSPRFYGATA